MIHLFLSETYHSRHCQIYWMTLEMCLLKQWFSNFSENLRTRKSILYKLRYWSYQVLFIETHLYLCMEYIVLHKNFSPYECRWYNQCLKASDHQHHYNWKMKLVHLLQRSIEGNPQELKFKSWLTLSCVIKTNTSNLHSKSTRLISNLIFPTILHILWSHILILILFIAKQKYS